MAKGNTIVLTDGWTDRSEWGIIGDTSKPGTIMEVDPGVAAVNGRMTWIAAASGTDGKSVGSAILCEDDIQGFGVSQAYVAGRMGRVFHLQRGDEFNGRCGEGGGTSNSFTVGQQLMVDAEDGVLVAYSGSPQETFAVAMEAATLVADSTLVWCKKL